MYHVMSRRHQGQRSGVKSTKGISALAGRLAVRLFQNSNSSELLRRKIPGDVLRPQDSGFKGPTHCG